MKIFKQDHEINPEGPQPSGSVLELKIALGAIAAGIVAIAGHEAVEAYENHSTCEIVMTNDNATAQQINQCY